jgi:hypothetical protein
MRNLLWESSVARHVEDYCLGGEAVWQRIYRATEWSWLTSCALIGKLDAILEHVAS